MSSKRLKTIELQVSWSNIQAWIATGLVSLGAIPEEIDVLSINLDYHGGYIPQDKIIPIHIITKEQGVEVTVYK